MMKKTFAFVVVWVSDSGAASVWGAKRGARCTTCTCTPHHWPKHEAYAKILFLSYFVSILNYNTVKCFVITLLIPSSCSS